MTLEERYNAAGTDTYVGRVKSFQAADAGAIDGVNFMNGEGFTGTPPAPDQVQTEFKRNAEGDFKYGGGGKVAGAYSLSRWLPKGINKGDTYLTNTKFNTVSDVRNASKRIQNYDWLSDANKFTGKSTTAKNRVDGSPAGVAPGGVNG